MIKRFIGKLANSNGQTNSQTKRTLIPAKKHPVRAKDISAFAVEVVETLQDNGYEAYIVGGCVRDLMLGMPPKDFDVATNATPGQVKQLFRRARIIGRRFQIVHVQDRRETIEVTTFRGSHTKATDKGSSRKSNRRGHKDMHAKQSDKGMLVRDNVFGSLEEDAIRRDFSCNALYFDPSDESIIDFTGAVADLKKGLLRTIGRPAERFKEDPVRMLRAIRFQAKLGLKLDTASQKQMAAQAHMIQEVSPARLFDEIIKLLLHSKSSTAFSLFWDSGLFALLFKGSAEAIEHNPALKKVLQVAMQHTEHRLGMGKGVSPFYLYATLLWPAVFSRYLVLVANNQPPARAMDAASSDALHEQNQWITIPKRFSISARETWHLQTQMHRRNGKRAAQLMEHARFRAAYDFILMREESGEDLNGLGKWWTEYQNANSDQREKMQSALGKDKTVRSRRRGRRRSKKPAVQSDS